MVRVPIISRLYNEIDGNRTLRLSKIFVPSAFTLANEQDSTGMNNFAPSQGETMSSAPEPKATTIMELKATLTLPQTAFPMKANLPQNEPLRLARWAELDLYAELRKAGQGRPAYLLHDGPPYANGPIHLGHALNKGLKDFVVKSKT